MWCVTYSPGVNIECGCTEWSQVTRYGKPITFTTRGQRSNLQCGNLPAHRGKIVPCLPIKCEYNAWKRSSISRVSFNSSLFLRVELSIRRLRYSSSASSCCISTKETQFVAGTKLGSSSWQCPSISFALSERIRRKTQNTCLSHPLHSPDLAPADFYLFRKVKFLLKGTSVVVEG